MRQTGIPPVVMTIDQLTNAWMGGLAALQKGMTADQKRESNATMSITVTTDTPASSEPRSANPRRGELFSRDRYWAIAFSAPYAAVFLVFVIYPIGYGLWLGSDPASYTALFSDPIYPRTVVNTLLYLLFGVNVKLAVALML
jgi:multiple sugar transport system permease protein